MNCLLLPPANVVCESYILHVSVILSTGGVLPQCMLGYHPPEQTTPPGADTPQSRHPPEADTPRSRHPPEQTPPWEQTPPREQTLPRVDTPRWEIRSTRGRYASYWNANLVCQIQTVRLSIEDLHKKGT